jgi:hypothetical protein
LEAIYQIIGGLEEDEKNNTFASSQNNVLALEATTKSQRQTKDKVLLQWLGVESIYIKRPFRCWRNIVENNKCRMEKRLIDTHLRCKRRRWMPSSEIW